MWRVEFRIVKFVLRNSASEEDCRTAYLSYYSYYYTWPRRIDSHSDTLTTHDCGFSELVSADSYPHYIYYNIKIEIFTQPLLCIARQLNIIMYVIMYCSAARVYRHYYSVDLKYAATMYMRGVIICCNNILYYYNIDVEWKWRIMYYYCVCSR